MFKHIVMWRFIDGANGKSKQQHAQWVKEHLEALVGVIPEIKALEVGINVCVAGTAYDAVLVSAFEDADALLDELAPEDFDGIFLPGGLPGTTNLRDNKDVITLVQNAHKEGKIISAI